MQVDSKDIGVAAFIVAQLGVIFGVGRTYGVLVERLETVEKSNKVFVEKFDVLDDEIEAEIEKGMLRIDTKISEIDSRFVTFNGEPRYVSYKAYDKIQQRCQQHLLAEMGHVRGSVGKMDKQLAGFSGQLQTVLVELAVLSGRNKKEDG